MNKIVIGLDVFNSSGNFKRSTWLARLVDPNHPAPSQLACTAALLLRHFFCSKPFNLSNLGAHRPKRSISKWLLTHSTPPCKSTRPLTAALPALPRCPSLTRKLLAAINSDLLRRLNPKHTTEHLNAIISLAPDLTEDLLSSVDQPLTIKRCKQSGRDYLLCDYNRDGDSYRSPWSNQFDPPLDEGGAGGVGAGGVSEGAGEGAIPSERVRKMEIRANDAFDVYRELYYEGGVSSVYFWNLDDGFAGVVLLKKCLSC